MKLLITGASSYVGARIYFDLMEKHELVGTYYTNRLSEKLVQLDLTKPSMVKQMLGKVRPEVVVHVANFPNASSAAGREEAYKALNWSATKSLVSGCNEIEAKLVFISGQAAFVTDNPYGKFKAMSLKWR